MKNKKALLLPNQQPTLRLTTRPNDANPMGDIFGGWLMSQIDMAGGITAAEVAKGAVATVAIKDLQFINPLFVYDVVSFYTKVQKVGLTSVTVTVEVYAQRRGDLLVGDVRKISEALLVYVAVVKPGEKREIPR